MNARSSDGISTIALRTTRLFGSWVSGIGSPPSLNPWAAIATTTWGRPHFQHAAFAVSRYSRPSTATASSISSWRSFIKTFSRIQPASRGLRHRSWRQRFDRDLRMQSDVEHIEDLGRPLQGNSEVFIPLIARHLGFMHAESAGKLTLGDTLGDP